MPLISYVSVVGMHVEDAQTAIEHAYLTSGILKSPHVSIVISSYASGIVLMGEVSQTRNLSYCRGRKTVRYPR